MQIDIQSRGFALTGALRQHIERRVLFALGWADYQVRKVDVRLSDLNGPRGGEDKRCQIQIVAAGIPEILIQDVETDVYVAIDRAADRAGRALARRLEKLREHRETRAYDDQSADSGAGEEAERHPARSSPTSATLH